MPFPGGVTGIVVDGVGVLWARRDGLVMPVFPPSTPGRTRSLMGWLVVALLPIMALTLVAGVGWGLVRRVLAW